MQSLNLLSPSQQEVIKMENFHIQGDGKTIEAGARFRYSKSFIAEWIWRVSVIVVLGWNGNVLNGLQERIADRIVEKIVSKSIQPKTQNPIVSVEDDQPAAQPRARRGRSRRAPAPAPPPGPAHTPPGEALRGVLSRGSFARVTPADVERLEGRIK